MGVLYIKSAGGTLALRNTVLVGVPGRPSGLAVTPMSDTLVALSWDRADDTDTSVQVWRQVGGSGAFVLHDTLAARENVYSDPSCDPSTAYAYQIVAVNGSGPSTSSLTNSTTTPVAAATFQAATGVSASAPNPWSVTVSWTDPGDVAGNHRWLIERSTGGVFKPAGWLQGVAGAMSWTDGGFNGPLSPGTAYNYRLRNMSANSYGTYAYASTSTPARTGQPAEPSGLTAVAQSDVLTVLSWADNSGGAAQTLIETANVSGTGTPETSSFTLAATVAAGTTTYNLATTARKGMYVRARCLQGGQNSGYTATRLHVTPSTPNAGGPQTYHVGPGQTYADFSAFAAGPWSSVGPGDTVFVHCNLDGSNNVIPWFVKPLIPWRGTAAAPIRFVGVNDTTSGSQPVIDGTNATTPNQFVGQSATTYEDLSLVLVNALATDTGTGTNGFAPGYLSIENLEVRNGYQGDNGGPANTYTYHDGTSHFYGGTSTSGSGSCSGIYLAKGDHVTILGCTIHGNGNGVFGSDGFTVGVGDNRRLAVVTLDSNYLYGNGTAGTTNDRQHNSYLECRGAVYQYNRYGVLRAGSGGGCIKDRSDGTVVRYNYLDGGASRLDIVEAQNHESAALISPSYYRTYVYGNVITNEANAAGVSFLIDYGGDTSGDWLYRRGVCYVMNNTFIIYSNTTAKSSVKLFELKSPALGSSFDARNNVVYAGSPDVNPATAVYALDKNGMVRFGSGWLSPGFSNAATSGGNAAVAGAGHLLNSTGNAPAFTGLSTGDYRPTGSSPFLGTGVALPGSMPTPLDHEYVLHQQSKARSLATDLGYYQQGT